MNMALQNAGVYDELLALYAQGALPAPAHALVGAHLELKPANRNFVRSLEAASAAALDEVEPMPLRDRDDRLAAIFASDRAPKAEAPQTDIILPPSLRHYLDVSSDDIPWQSVIPGFKQWDLGEQDGCDVHMFWIKPGRKMPSHTHEGTELFLVLDGSFDDDIGHYGKGDISIADESVDHRPIAGNERPCIGFSVNDAPLRLTGSLAERIGMFFGH